MALRARPPMALRARPPMALRARPPMALRARPLAWPEWPGAGPATGPGAPARRNADAQVMADRCRTASAA